MESGSIFNAYKMYHVLLHNQIGHFESLLNNKMLVDDLKARNFDLFILDECHDACGAILIDYLDIPTILYSNHGFGMKPWFDRPTGLGHASSVYSKAGRNAAFVSRVLDFLDHVVTFYWYLPREYFPHMTELRAKIGYNASRLDVMEAYRTRISLILVNTAFSIDYPRPHMPAVKLIGGFFSTPAKALSKDLEDFVEGSGESGVIVVSFGIILNVYPKADVLAKALARLPQRVVWRFDGDPPPNVGSNTKILRWIPQNDMLGHRRTRLFITHCGASATQETIYHGVPVVAFPFLYDQPINSERLCDRLKMGVALDFETFTEDSLLRAITQVLQNQSYSANAKRASELFQDVPMSPKDTALYWVNYVLRYKGAAHLTKEYIDTGSMSLFRYYQFDVLAVIVAGILCVIILTIFFLSCICKLLRYVFTASRRVKQKTN